jgi:Leucine-rich repeat (LRR) protein
MGDKSGSWICTYHKDAECSTLRYVRDSHIKLSFLTSISSSVSRPTRGHVLGSLSHILRHKGGMQVPTEPAHINLGLEIIKASFKAIFPGISTRVEGLADLAGLAFSGSDRWLEQNDFKRQLEGAADLLASKLGKITSPEFRALDPAERGIATGVVEKVVMESKLTKQDLEYNKLLNSDSLFKQLEPGCQGSWNHEELSDAAIQYGRVLLRGTCDYIINLVRSLPEFNDDITWQTYVETRGLSDNLTSTIESVILPRFRPGTPSEVTEFEAKYATAVITSLGMMELFGLDLPAELQRQPLNIAYITLTASAQDRAPERFDAVLGRILAEVAEISQVESTAKTRFRREIAPWAKGSADKPEIVLGNQQGSSARSDSNETRGPIRILITGEAGSGKTTVVRWLAVQIAAHKLPRGLSAMRNALPLFVPLRHVFRGARLSPNSDDLMDYVLSGRNAGLPGNWLDERLRSGQMLLIFDGLDELSDINRSRALTWIEGLVSDYPKCDFIVTSRPEGYDPSWFVARKFSRIQLRKMDLPDIHNCITGWFEALRQGTPHVDWDRHERSKRALLADIDSRASVRDLAESPLLCAMLCAFYTLRIKAAPRSRAELYRRVIEGLVGRESARRAAIDHGLQLLDVPQTLSLLQAVAREMVETHRTEVSVRRDPDMSITSDATAYQIIEARLSGMLAPGVTPDQAVRYLTERSVVFHMIGPNVAQFAHRTFQEYLAGRDFALSGRVDVLLRHVAEREWHQIFAFAASAAPTDVATRLVEEILNVDSSVDDWERERLMLAAECLSAAAPGVHPEVAVKARSAIARILPPLTDEEAVLVSAFGEGILPWLVADEHRRVDINRTCIRAASLVGGPEALHVLAKYSASSQSAGLEDTLTAEWGRFPYDDYAKVVLSNCALASTLTISQKGVLEAVRLLPQVQKIRVEARDGLVDLRSWSSLTNLRELDLGGLPSLVSVQGIGSLVSLRKLNLSEVPATEGFEELAVLDHLVDLYINRCSGLTDPTPLKQLTSLRTLHMAGCVNIREFSWIGKLAEIWNLDLSGTRVSDLSFCRSLVDLRRLRAKVSTGVMGELDLSPARHLRDLTLKLGSWHDWALPTSGALQSVSLSGDISDDDLSVLAQSPSIRSLYIEDGSRLESLEPLRSNVSLRHLSIGEVSEVPDLEPLRSLHELRSLELPDSAIESLEFVEGMVNLERLILDGCRRLFDVSLLEQLSSLKYVSMVNGVSRVDEVVLSQIAKDCGFRYEWDPYDPNESSGASS